MVDNHRIRLAGEIDAQTVDAVDFDVAAADGRCFEGQRRAALPRDVQPDGVRVRPTEIDLLKAHVHALLTGDFQRIAQAGVIDVHPQQSADDSAVCAMPAVCFSERAMQPDIRLDHPFAQQRIRGQPNARRARGMGAAWPNHHGTYQVEQIHAFHAFPGKRFFPAFLLYCTCFSMTLQWIFARKTPRCTMFFQCSRVIYTDFCKILRIV